MQKLKKVLSFVQKTQNYFIILFIFPFLSIGEHEKTLQLQSRESAYTLKKVSEILMLQNQRLTVTAPLPIMKLYDEGLKFYQLNDFQPVWTMGFQPNENGKKLLNLVNESHDFGLFPEKLFISELQQANALLTKQGDAEAMFQERAKFEKIMSGIAVKFISQLKYGMLKTDSLLNNNANNLMHLDHCRYYLLEALDSEDFVSKFLAAQPVSKPYNDIQTGLESWLAKVKLSKDSIHIEDENLWPSVHHALKVHGYFSEEEYLDSANTSDKLKEFQQDMGLHPTGLLSKETKGLLSKSTFDYFVQIAVNIERLKTETLSRKNNFVYVNIPSYNVKVIRNGKTDRIFKAVVGKPVTPTPELTSKIEHIITCPKWFVPKSIAKRELFYHMKKDSTYLEKRDFMLLDEGFNRVAYNELDWNNMNAWDFEYKVMQQPGRYNALGTLKFLFPNPYSVYLHDTPAKKYFKRDIRAYSHGCVRLEQPDQFADYLLQEVVQKKDAVSVNQYIKNGQTMEIVLEEPVDIAIRYYTCEIGESNNLVFLHDIYQKDKPIIEQILN